MKIEQVTARNIGFSTFPATLRHNTTSSVSHFEDARTRPGGWFGPVMFTLVEVHGDDGTVGIGTAGAFHGGAKDLVTTYYADLLIGEDPRRHEYLWDRMFRTNVRFGRSGSAVAALSALDIACWDLHGRSEGRSIAELLGGPTRSQVPCYVSRLYALEDLEELAAEAERWRDMGFIRMKQRFGFGPADGPLGMRRNVELVRTVREVVGDEIEIAGEAYMGWDLGYAIRMAKLLEPYNLSWIEEPLMPQEIDGYVDLKRRCPWTRWSCGEHSYTKWDFQHLIERRAVDILQPDANRVGGITELSKICTLAEVAGLPVIPHSNEAHNLQVIFAKTPSVCPVVEFFPDVQPDTGNELFWRVFEGNPVAENGTIRAPVGPGLGVGVNRDAVEEFAVGDLAVVS